MKYYKDETQLREYAEMLKGQDIASIDNLTINFIREWKDKINFDILLHAGWLCYHLDEKIKHEFKGYDLR